MKQYIDLMKHILEHGQERNDRTGTGTLGIFGHQMRFDLRKAFPAVTTKKLAWKAMTSELLFFMQHLPDRRLLQEMIHGSFNEDRFDIWRGNCLDAKTKNPLLFNGYNLGNMYPVYWRMMPNENLSKIVPITVRKDIDADYIEPYKEWYDLSVIKPHKLSGEIFTHTTTGSTLELLGILESDIFLRYENSGAVIRVRNSEVNMKNRILLTGRDYYEKNDKGGYLGAPLEVLNEDPIHSKTQALWYNMLSRVNDSDFYKNISISPRWLNYFNFMTDIRCIPNFMKWVKQNSDYEIDKDYFGSEIYSRNTVIFVPKNVNQLLIRKKDDFAYLTIGGNKYLTKRCAMESIFGRIRVPKNFDQYMKKNGYSVTYAPTVDNVVYRPQLFTDQLQTLVNNIKEVKENPQASCGRRLIMDSWNPNWDDDSCLGICHPWVQCYVRNGKLDLMFTMRSSDVFLGLPMNIASYALLTHILAQVTGLEVGELIYSAGDVHIYKNHLEQVQEQILREPKELPQLWIDTSITDIDSFTMDSFRLENYDPMDSIKAPMAV